MQRSNLYYCDPMRSGQKGDIEQAHTMLRDVLPKKTCFEYLTQWNVNTIVNPMNSTSRESLQGRTPYQVALETLGEDIHYNHRKTLSEMVTQTFEFMQTFTW